MIIYVCILCILSYLVLLLAPTTAARVKRLMASLCPHDNSEMNDPKVFKFDVGDDLGIAYM